MEGGGPDVCGHSTEEMEGGGPDVCGHSAEEMEGGRSWGRGRGVTLHSSPGLSKYPRSLHGSARRSKRLSAICVVSKGGGAFRNLTVHRHIRGELRQRRILSVSELI